MWGVAPKVRSCSLKPVEHAAVSAAVGGVAWAATGEPAAFAASMAVGVLIDVDHLLDFYNWYRRRDRRHLLVLLHAWEYSLAGLVALLAGLTDPLLVGALLGHAAHLAGDQVANPVRPMGYFLLYRLRHRFLRDRLLDQRLAPLDQVLEENVPLWGPVRAVAGRAVRRLRDGRG